MSAGIVVFDVLLVVATVVFLRAAPRIWRNETGLTSDEPMPTWVGGTAGWRAFVRASTLLFPVCWALAATAFVIGTVTAAAWAETVSAVLGATAGLLIFLGGAAVALLNRPKWLVAPHLRHQPGLVAELLGAPVAPTPAPLRARHWER